MVRTSVVGLLVLLALTVACAQSETPTTAPVPSPAPAAPAVTPTPAPAVPATPAPAVPALSGATGVESPSSALTAFLAHPDGQPLVPGGPPLFAKQLSQEPGIQIIYKYHQTKLPLWTKAQYGGEFRTSAVFTPVNLNLLGNQVLSRPSYAGMLLLFDMGRCSMVDRDADFSRCGGKYGNNQSIAIIPGVFDRWEQTGQTTYVFHIRPGVIWPAVPPMARADRTVTAEDVAWFLETTKKEGILKDNFQLVDKFEAVDKSTVRVTLQSPVAEFMRHMSNSSMGIFPKECYDEKGCLTGKLVSPGPFLIKELVLRERMLLVKNQEFHLRGLPYVDRIVGIQIPDPAAVKSSFITGQLDNYSIQGTETEMKSVAQKVSGVQIMSQVVLAGTSVLRPQLKGPMSDVRVRRAMALTMEHPAMWQIGQEGFAYFPNIVSRDFFGADWYYTLEQAGSWYKFNPTKAKGLIKEAGYENGFKLNLVLPSFFSSGGPNEEMLFLQSNWKKHLGIDVTIQIAEPVPYASMLYERTWDGVYYQYGWNVSFWAEGDAAVGHFVKGNRLNFQNVDDQFMTDIYPKVRGELDAAKRAGLLWQVEQRELDQVYLLRVAPPASFQLMQPWEMNGAAHQVAWWASLNGPTWLTMLDPGKAPKQR
ncbi:MAG: ABC transporter substrate-binding protein [Dehalococcoidia bacterium]|nr:ABC transporter substrate-binding protein [Dehalococcoidia bacterium]